MIHSAKTLLLLTLASLPLCAQWKNVPDDVPRTKDGKVDLNAPVPRRADGKPDLTGPWRPVSLKWVNDIGVDLKPEDFQVQPWAADLVKVRTVNQGDEPDSNCLPSGVPKADNTPNPFVIVPAGPKMMVILYETFHMYRRLFMDGREFDANSLYNPAWLGFSTAKWDGDTLVVETFGSNERPWLDKAGHPTSESQHVTERFHRVDFGHMDLTVTIDDPKVFNKPFTVNEHHVYFPGDIVEFVCENEHDARHMPNSK